MPKSDYSALRFRVNPRAVPWSTGAEARRDTDNRDVAGQVKGVEKHRPAGGRPVRRLSALAPGGGCGSLGVSIVDLKLSALFVDCPLIP
jgi:hypothetical protein